MSGWLARLKNERAPEVAPTKPTKPLGGDAGAGFVGFAGAESGAEPNLQRGELTPGADHAELSEQYARAREGRFSEALGTATAGEPVLVDDAMAARVQRFTERGIAPNEVARLALRLQARDQDRDDRRMCLECSYLGAQGRCIAAATGRLRGVSAALTPVPDILQRCEAFGLRKGLA